MGISQGHLIPIASGTREIVRDRSEEGLLLKMQLVETQLELLALRIGRIEENREFFAVPASAVVD